MKTPKPHAIRLALLELVGKGHTQVQIAARYGTSERSIRRWKNEGVQPSQASAPAVLKIQHVARSIRAAKTRRNEKYTQIDEATGEILFAPILTPKVKGYTPVGERRQVRDKFIRREKKGRKKKGETQKYREVWSHKLSDSVDYVIKPLTALEQIEFAYRLLQNGDSIKFVFTAENESWEEDDMSEDVDVDDFVDKVARQKTIWQTGVGVSPEFLRTASGRTLASFTKYMQRDTQYGLGRAIGGVAARLIATPAAYAPERKVGRKGR